jgi:hypothetical protein
LEVQRPSQKHPSDTASGASRKDCREDLNAVTLVLVWLQHGADPAKGPEDGRAMPPIVVTDENIKQILRAHAEKTQAKPAQ